MARPRDALALDDQLCFALYAASRAMTARYRPLLESVGLTYPQFLVMIVLWDEGPSTVRELGERLRLDSGTLSPLLKRLESSGLVVRERRSDDERSVLVTPTPKGRRLRQRAIRIPATIGTSLDGFDGARLIAELHDLEAALREQ